jgi:4-amino-4-deoxy-L-arabinose transferase-like glycosyltransferase
MPLGLSRWQAALALILAGGAALRLWLLARGLPTLDSDEATIGLMALHLRHGEWSVFFWGQSYMGSLEAVVAAPFVWLLGPSASALRLAPLLMGLAAIAAVAVLAARLYSPRVALVAAVLLAFGSPYFIVLSVRAYGGYVETLLLGALLLLLALGGSEPAGRSWWATALLGLLAGLALWTNLLVAPFLLAVAAILWWQRRTDLLGRKGLLLLATLLLGAAPAIVYNVANGAATLTTILGITAVGARGPGAVVPSLPGNVWLLLTVSLPILGGGFLGGYQSAGLTIGDYRLAATAQPLAYAVDLLLTLGAVALLAAAGLGALRGWRELRAPASAVEAGPAERARRVQRQGEAALLLITACYVVAMILTRRSDLFAVPRYLFPIATCAPVLARQLLRVTDWAAVRRASHGVIHIARTALPALALAALLSWNLAGAAAVNPVGTAALDHGVWVTNDDAPLLALLRAHHVRTVISNDYWEGLRLTFESGETCIAVMVTPQGHPGFNRYSPYVTGGLADARPAYVELSATPEAALRLAQLHAGALPSYMTAVVGQFTVLVPA